MHFLNILSQELTNNSNLQILLISFFGLCFGSFASLVTGRIETAQPIIFARSKCANCNFSLGIKNLIPVFSWIFQRGKCSNCHLKISIRYPLIEIFFAAIFLLIYFQKGQIINQKLLIYLVISAILLMMIIADLEHYIIPDSYQYILIIFATILFISQSENEVKIILEHVKSAFLYLGFGLVLWFYFYIITKIDAIGVDDLKFFFVAGFLLGQENFLNFMFLSGIIGVIFGGFWTKIKKENIFPFAPALCLAALICLIFDKKFNIIDLAGYIIFQI